GDIEPFPSGKMTYLAPLPLPTPMPPYGPHIGDLNDVYMDFGLGSPQVFSWQVILGGPLTVLLMIIIFFPLTGGLLGLTFGDAWSDISSAMVGIFLVSYGDALITFFVGLFIGLGVWHHNHKKRSTLIP
ncbi:hypothetical protein C4E44_13490, partial [Pseudomonas sp. MWU12-2312b]